MLSSSSSEQNTSLEGGNGSIGNTLVASSEPKTSTQNVIRNTSRTTTPVASRPFWVYGLPSSYTPLVATTYICLMPMWYDMDPLTPQQRLAQE